MIHTFIYIHIHIYRYTLGIVVGVGAGLHYSTIHELELTAGEVEILCDFDSKTGQRITRVNRIEKVGKFPATRPGTQKKNEKSRLELSSIKNLLEH